MHFLHRFLSAALVCLALAVPGAFAQGWPHYGGDEGGSRFSPLTQINRENVAQLELAWQFRTGAVKDNPTLKKYIDFQNTPTLLPAAAGKAFHNCVNHMESSWHSSEVSVACTRLNWFAGVMPRPSVVSGQFPLMTRAGVPSALLATRVA